MPTQIISLFSPNSILLTNLSSKDRKSQLTRFVTWLDSISIKWFEVDLDAYRDSLLLTLASNSVKAHLSNIRSQYKRILTDNQTHKQTHRHCHRHTCQISNTHTHT